MKQGQETWSLALTCSLHEEVHSVEKAIDGLEVVYALQMQMQMQKELQNTQQV